LSTGKNNYNSETVLEAFQRGEYELVFQTALPHAQAGNSDAQYMVSLLYQNGLGVDRDLTEAEHWLLRAAEQNSPVAWNNLGTLYATGGAGLVGGPERARECYERAKELGFNCAAPYPPPACE
jgi:TPR repeat protein